MEDLRVFFEVVLSQHSMKVNVFGKKTRRISQANRWAAIHRESVHFEFNCETLFILHNSECAWQDGSACARVLALKRHRRHATGIGKKMCANMCVFVCE